MARGLLQAFVSYSNTLDGCDQVPRRRAQAWFDVNQQSRVRIASCNGAFQRVASRNVAANEFRQLQARASAFA